MVPVLTVCVGGTLNQIWLLCAAAGDLGFCGPDSSHLNKEGSLSGLGMPVSEDLYFLSVFLSPLPKRNGIHPKREGSAADPLSIRQLARRHLYIPGPCHRMGKRGGPGRYHSYPLAWTPASNGVLVSWIKPTFCQPTGK